MKRLGPILARVLLIAATVTVLLDLVTFRFDDVIYYWKTSTLSLGYVPQVDPADDRLFRTVEYLAHPQNYRPHPGANLPYLDFSCEYPPLAWLFLLLPHLGGHDIYTFIVLFMLEMIALYLAAWWMCSRAGRRLNLPTPPSWTTLAFGSAFTLCISVFLLRRFDISSAVLVAGAVVTLSAKRPFWTGVLLGLAAATKLWPGLLVPFFALPWLVDRRWREVLKMGGAAAFAFLLPHVLVMAYAGPRAFEYFTFHGERGLQIESLWGNLAVIVQKLSGRTPVSDLSHSAAHVSLEAPIRSALVGLSYVAMMGGAVLIWRAAYRRLLRTAEFGERVQVTLLGSLGLVLVTLAAAKVFSPQYLLWLVPFFGALGGKAGRDLRWGLVLAAALTRLEFSFLFVDVATYGWQGALVVFVRNLVVVWLVWRTFRALSTEPEPQAEAVAIPTTG